MKRTSKVIILRATKARPRIRAWLEGAYLAIEPEGDLPDREKIGVYLDAMRKLKRA